jgi:molybdopterin-containing oxidoreductase family iron-sulfur binding subunit
MGYEIRRRDFFKLLGAGGATAALMGCAEAPPEQVVPYLIPPEESIPGVAIWYATVCRECPAGCGMLARTREGRVVKVEGNPVHPVNQGRLCARGQASLQGLYNPDRIQQPLLRAPDGQFRPISWDEAEKRVAVRLTALYQQGQTDRVVFVTPHLTGSLDALIDTWLAALGSAHRLRYEAFAYEPLRVANRITFGREVIPTYDIAQAELLLSFGADFLETWLSPVAYAREFAAMRAYRDGRIGTFFYVGPRLSVTAANADDWIATRPGTEGFLAFGMIHVILAEGLAATLPEKEREQLTALARPYTPKRVAELTEISEGTIYRLARLFALSRPSLALGGGIATTGSNATATCVAVNLLNYVAGNIGTTVRFGPVARTGPNGTYRDMLKLIDAMHAGRIEVLFLYGTNPMFTLPEAAGFWQALQKVPLVVSFSSFPDETAGAAHLVLPDHTPLESWGDHMPWQGVHGLMQPVMRPLFRTKAVGDVLLALARRVSDQMAQRFPQPTFYAYLRDRWQALHQRLEPDTDFDAFWEKALKQGGVWEEVQPESVTLTDEAFRIPVEDVRLDGGIAATLSLYLYPSLIHFDGRGANRPWLQELPEPMTQIVWDNWLEIHPETARRLGISEGELVEVKSPFGGVELPVHLYPWVRPDVVAVPLGQGHTALGRYAENRGANPMALLPARAEPRAGSMVHLATKVKLARTGKHYMLVSTVGSDRQGTRGIAQAIPLTEVRARAEGKAALEEMPQMYPAHPHPEHRWGMAVDLNACIGCSACAVACYAENNIAVVGKDWVSEGREMAWLRIERYVEDRHGQLEIRFLPMFCQQCENAPCEPVCPVYATYHTPEGLNAQIYNRCVGVRYCSNNCPYKVRRFNWFDYQWPEPLHLQLNPDVTVREKGIMEKCTFCIQRIHEAEDRAKDEGRHAREGEIVPACAQTCPTQAIVFGDLNDPYSAVSKLARHPRRYRVLEHLNTQPAVVYLRKISQNTERA